MARSADLLFAGLLLVAGRLSLLHRFDATLLDWLLLDAWLIPLYFAARDSGQRNHQQDQAKPKEGVAKNATE